MPKLLYIVSSTIEAIVLADSAEDAMRIAREQRVIQRSFAYTSMEPDAVERMTYLPSDIDPVTDGDVLVHCDNEDGMTLEDALKIDPTPIEAIEAWRNHPSVRESAKLANVDKPKE